MKKNNLKKESSLLGARETKKVNEYRRLVPASPNKSEIKTAREIIE
jgi:hypothetical protein